MSELLPQQPNLLEAMLVIKGAMMPQPVMTGKCKFYVTYYDSYSAENVADTGFSDHRHP